jgi:dihydroorotate dehydrogenase electron transfer subunit
MGRKAFVTDVLKEIIDEVDEVCACGPMPMLKGIAEICEKADKPCQVSLEERMGCGIGACLVCACAVKRNDGSQDYVHVCKDGPVFDSREVVF